MSLSVFPSEGWAAKRYRNDCSAELLEFGEITEPLLTAKEEFELGTQVANGIEAAATLSELHDFHPLRTVLNEIVAQGQQAKDKFVLSNLRLVIKIARDFARPGISVGDLISEGTIGLIRAVDDYDVDFGTRFSTYATYWIKQRIRIAVNGSTVRLPPHMVTALAKFTQAQDDLREEIGHKPGFSVVVTAMGLTENEKQSLAKAIRTRNLISLQGFVGEDSAWEDSPLLGVTDDKAIEEVDQTQLQETISSQINDLDKVDKRLPMIIRLRFLEEKTLKEIGDILGITRERVRQLEQKGMRLLRKRFQKTNRAAS